MIASPPGGLYEAASVAEHEEETEIAIDVSLRWRVEAIRVDYIVTPTVESRLEDHKAGPMARLIKERKARGLAPLAAHGDGILQRRRQTGAQYIFSYIFFVHWQAFLCGEASLHGHIYFCLFLAPWQHAVSFSLTRHKQTSPLPWWGVVAAVAAGMSISGHAQSLHTARRKMPCCICSLCTHAARSRDAQTPQGFVSSPSKFLRMHRLKQNFPRAKPEQAYHY